METKNQTSTPGATVETLTEGNTLFVRARKVNNKKTGGAKMSIEVAEVINNPERPLSALADLNAGDERFDNVRPRAQRGFVTVEPQVAFDEFGISKEAFDKLEKSTGVDSKDWKEGQHYIMLNLLNPRLKGKRVRLQINESTTPREGGRAKINPATGATIMHQGAPVYRTVQLVYDGTVRNSFLQSDGTIAAGIPASEKSAAPQLSELKG